MPGVQISSPRPRVSGLRAICSKPFFYHLSIAAHGILNAKFEITDQATEAYRLPVRLLIHPVIRLVPCNNAPHRHCSLFLAWPSYSHAFLGIAAVHVPEHPSQRDHENKRHGKRQQVCQGLGINHAVQAHHPGKNNNGWDKKDSLTRNAEQPALQSLAHGKKKRGIHHNYTEQRKRDGIDLQCLAAECHKRRVIRAELLHEYIGKAKNNT
eukprot:TRINITY_DN11797_c0_g3_i1.p2 TRINITY_DN11797_c0_g3~~TRINITY_DN11797_c0_g3_i1.p2  ORF type:complete len:210 (+),score=17.62 TRINITY_DN11797_c0_g3_i1:119-748(+)